jgi:hypothetical protein
MHIRIIAALTVKFYVQVPLLTTSIDTACRFLYKQDMAIETPNFAGIDIKRRGIYVRSRPFGIAGRAVLRRQRAAVQRP